MKNIFLLIIFVCSFLQAQTVEGDWEGEILILGGKLTIKVRFASVEDKLTATMDIVEQFANNLPLKEIKHEGEKLHFELHSPNGVAKFDGKWVENRWEGDFAQKTFYGKFFLRKPKEQKTTSLPYKEEEVVFTNGNIKIAGTLTIPLEGDAHPALILITGSGAQNRDEEIFGFRIFQIIADHLSRNGIAVLRTDDRGVGGSNGNLKDATLLDLAGDVLCGIEFLKKRSDINAKKIGLCGHSEGGIIAPLAATKSEDVAFLILLAGTGVDGEKILVAQNKLILGVSNVKPEKIALQLEMLRLTFLAVRTNEGWDEVKKILRKQVAQEVEELSPEIRNSLGDVEKYINDTLEVSLMILQSESLKYFITYDPAPALAKIQSPVLALFGELDLQVPYDINEQAMRQAFVQSGHKDYTIKTFPKTNHLFLLAKTGSPEEYWSLEKKFIPEFLPTITDWLKERVK